MSLWIRIGNSAFKVSVEQYSGWKLHRSPFGVLLIFGCVGFALFRRMDAYIGTKSIKS